MHLLIRRMSATEYSSTGEPQAQPVQLAESNFAAEVLQSGQPVLVNFWAPWSRPCQILDPILKEIAAVWAGKARVVKINADDSLELSLTYDIQSIPTLLYFVEGQLRVRIVGTASKEAILAKLKPFGLPV